MPVSPTDSKDDPQSQPSSDELVMRLFLQHQRVLFVYLRTLLNNSSDAEEILQETSIVVWRKRDQFTVGTNFVNWALAIAHFEVCKFLRNRERHPKALNGELIEKITAEFIADHDLTESRHRALANCLAALNDSDRRLVDLTYSGNSTKKAVGEKLGISPIRFYKELNRIRLRLQKCIQLRLVAEEHA
jgi:RNA polymerase sigma-70 factor, ECF subfamily